MDINSILSIASLVITGVVLSLLYLRSKSQTVKEEVQSFKSIDRVLEAVKNEMVEIVKDDFTLALSDEEFDRLYKRKAKVNEALKNCVYGIDGAKVRVIDLIRGFIAEKVPKEQVTVLLGLTENTEPSNHIKFEILMYKYKKIYGKGALVTLIDKYGLGKERIATDAQSRSDKAYYITEEDLNNVYSAENINLTIDEQIDVLSVLIYQMYKGFGIIDTLREMDINGFNMGTSGSILSISKLPGGEDFRSNNAVWLYDRGKYIHLRFMNYGNEEELRRIIQLLIRWGNPGPLTSKRGYLVNTMYDKSRVLALRPPAAEHWAIFVRKFTLSDVSPEKLIIQHYTVNGETCVKLIEFLMRGKITCGITGRQGSGKTTLLSAIIRYIDPRYTIRVLEIAPELYLRELYPTRNILSVQETTTVTAAELQDALKKSDAAVSIVGEVASDDIAARMIGMATVASLYTIFTHHANTAKDLVLALRNSLVNAGGFNNMHTAEKQVTDVVKIDIHLDYTPDGKRYVDRISEIVPLDEGVPYPEYDEADPINSMNKITAEYYKRSTDRISFHTQDILKYDLDTHTYKVVNRFSPQLEERIRMGLDKEYRLLFDKFMLENWGAPDNSDLGTDQLLEQVETEMQEAGIDPSFNEKIIDGLSNESLNNLIEDTEFKRAWAEGYIDGKPVTENDKTLRAEKQLDEFDFSSFFSDDVYK